MALVRHHLAIPTFAPLFANTFFKNQYAVAALDLFVRYYRRRRCLDRCRRQRIVDVVASERAKEKRCERSSGREKNHWRQLVLNLEPGG